MVCTITGVLNHRYVTSHRKNLCSLLSIVGEFNGGGGLSNDRNISLQAKIKLMNFISEVCNNLVFHHLFDLIQRPIFKKN